jgi:hypothetical protein
VCPVYCPFVSIDFVRYYVTSGFRHYLKGTKGGGQTNSSRNRGGFFLAPSMMLRRSTKFLAPLYIVLRSNLPDTILLIVMFGFVIDVLEGCIPGRTSWISSLIQFLSVR